jgi:branched-chain amino acid aminotransferase
MTALASVMGEGGELRVDPRNRDNLVYVNGRMVHRDEATVPVYDSGFMLGDGVWEGIRLHQGALLFVEDHLERLFAGARTIGIEVPWSRADLIDAMRRVARENRMDHNVHMRMMMTRGTRIACDQDPRLCTQGPNLVIIPEYKDEVTNEKLKPVRLVSVHIRRGLPDTQDPKLNSHSKLNCILAMLAARPSGADEALMMDVNGFVNTCNSVNFFIIRGGEVWTSTGDYCMNGITRAKTIDVCRELGIPVRQKNYSLVETYSADGAFITGTTGAQVPVREIDGRGIGPEQPVDLFWKIRRAYKELCAAYAREHRFIGAAA